MARRRRACRWPGGGGGVCSCDVRVECDGGVGAGVMVGYLGVRVAGVETPGGTRPGPHSGHGSRRAVIGGNNPVAGPMRWSWGNSPAYAGVWKASGIRSRGKARTLVAARSTAFARSMFPG